MPACAVGAAARAAATKREPAAVATAHITAQPQIEPIYAISTVDTNAIPENRSDIQLEPVGVMVWAAGVLQHGRIV